MTMDVSICITNVHDDEEDCAYFISCNSNSSEYRIFNELSECILVEEQELFDLIHSFFKEKIKRSSVYDEFTS
jgi:hypothetical protein